jgi:2-dehydropantoate 2-reductase
MLSHQPQWLRPILEDHGISPRLYAWGLDNLETSAAQTSGHSVSNFSEPERIHVLGLGNLGRLLAASLAEHLEAPPITLVFHRKELLDEWAKSHGIEIAKPGGLLHRNKNFHVEWWTETPPTHGPVREVAQGNKLNNLIIATKASAALPSADRIRRYLGRGSNLAFVQNGMSKLWPPYGPTYASHRYTPENRPNFLSCVVTHGLFSQGPFSSFHASVAGLSIGPVLVDPETAGLTNYLTHQILAAPHLNAVAVSQADLWVRQLEKVVVNSVINPLTAILRVKNGSLFFNPPPGLDIVIDRLLEEASQVLQALISHSLSDSILDSSQGAHRGSKETSVTRLELMQRFEKPQLAHMLRQVGLAVKDNRSSMLQDVEAGRSTEIRDFNGWFTDMAAFLDMGSKTPIHSRLMHLIENNATMGPEELCKNLLTQR